MVFVAADVPSRFFFLKSHVFVKILRFTLNLFYCCTFNAILSTYLFNQKLYNVDAIIKSFNIDIPSFALTFLSIHCPVTFKFLRSMRAYSTWFSNWYNIFCNERRFNV